jgi:hypothetical protein
VTETFELKGRIDVAVDALLQLKRAAYAENPGLVGACNWAVKTILEARAQLPLDQPLPEEQAA